MNFGIGDLHVIPLHNCEFCEYWCSKCHTLLMGVYIILPFSTFLAQFGKIWYKGCTQKLLTEHKFCRNMCSDNNSLLRGINKFLSLLSTFIVQFV